MTVETATLINELNALYPLDADDASEGAAHIRLVKQLLQENYANGTWTPSVTFSAVGNFVPTYLLRVGYYHRIEDFCMISMMLRWTSNAHTTASGNLRITGLPFAATADMATQTIPIGRTDTLSISSTGRGLGLVCTAGSTEATIAQTLNAATSTTLGLAEAPASSTFRVEVNGLYKVTS